MPYPTPASFRRFASRFIDAAAPKAKKNVLPNGRTSNQTPQTNFSVQ